MDQVCCDVAWDTVLEQVHVLRGVHNPLQPTQCSCASWDGATKHTARVVSRGVLPTISRVTPIDSTPSTVDLSNSTQSYDGTPPFANHFCSVTWQCQITSLYRLKSVTALQKYFAKEAVKL